MIIPTKRPRGSLHNLEELAGLSDLPDKLLLVSDRTLSILNDLGRVDAAMLVRYAKAIYVAAYDAVEPGDAEQAVVDTLIMNLHRELMPMSLDINNLTWAFGEWYKQPYVPGFGGNVSEQKQNTALAAGGNVIDGTAAPAGSLWRLTNSSVMYVGTVASVGLSLQAIINSQAQTLLHVLNPVSGQWYVWNGDLMLQAGDLVRLSISNATLNDDAYLRYVVQESPLDAA